MTPLGFTIIFNGAHHLQHNGYAEKMAGILNQWVFVEGLSLPGGSTSWCKRIPDKYHKNGSSADDTVKVIRDLQTRHKNIHLILPPAGGWKSKDLMVNAAMDKIRNLVPPDAKACLWEIDADEQWERDDMCRACRQMEYLDADCATFLCDYYVGKDIVARGEWGEGNLTRYTRLWRWKPNLRFKTHEPPEMLGGNGKTLSLKERFKHYAYYFPQDVEFKDRYYSGHEGVYARWQRLQQEYVWPQPIGRLITGAWGNTKTTLEKI